MMVLNFSLRLLLIGDSSVGKSSIRTRFCEGRWPIGYGPVINAHYLCRTVNVDGRRVKLQVVDSNGEERWMHVVRSCGYYRDIHGVLLVYDLTNESSFQNIRDWNEQVNEHAPLGVVKILVGNKSDLVEERVVAEEQGRQLASELGMRFMLTSAKVNEGVEEAFSSLVRDFRTFIGDSPADDVPRGLSTYLAVGFFLSLASILLPLLSSQ